MLNVIQSVNPDQSFVMGRNGLWQIKELHIWQTGGGRIVFDCISRSNRVLNAGFGIDKESFDLLVCNINDRMQGDVTGQ